MTGGTWLLGHRPALDGLRGIAILLVVAGHATAPWTEVFDAGGPVGVTVFFTLSGFLITALLLQERQGGPIRLGAFYLRRTRRLLPALLVYVGVVAVLSAVLGLVARRDVLGALFYVANWLPASGRPVGDALAHTWSLAVEEQFYIVWPLVLIAVTRWMPRGLLAVAVGGVVASTLLRLVLWDGAAGWARVYYGTDTRADSLLAGCALAVVMLRFPVRPTRGRLASLVLGLIVVLGFSTGFVRFMVVPTAVAALTVGMIALTASGPYQGWLTSRPLVWFGRRAYGLYLWHVLFTLVLVPSLGLHWLPGITLGVGLSLVAAELSWRYVEEPWLGRLLRPGREDVVLDGPHQPVALRPAHQPSA